MSKNSYNYHLVSAHRIQLPSSTDKRGAFDVNGPNYYCSIRKRHYHNNGKYRAHLKYVHTMVLPKAPSLKFDKNVIPDIDDTNFYCRSCQKRSANKLSFKRHLNDIHKMNLITPRVKVNLSLKPDIHDPNFYCKVCLRSCNDRKSYRRHLEIVHKIGLAPERKRPKYDPNIKADTDDSGKSCCVICKLIFEEKRYYDIHMKRHKKQGHMAPLRGRLRINDDITPDLNDPNNYCSWYDFCKKVELQRTRSTTA